MYDHCVPQGFQSLDGLRKQVNILPAALNEIENEATEYKIKAVANGYIKQLCEFQFYIVLIISTTIFQITDRLSKQLQSIDVSTGEGVTMCGFTKACLLNMRSDIYFDDIWNSALELATGCDADEPKLPRKRKSPLRYEIGATDGDHYESPKQFYRALFYQVIDETVSSLVRRIEDKSIPVLSSVENILYAAWTGAVINKCDLKDVTNHFGDDLNPDKLTSQLYTLNNLKKEEEIKDEIIAWNTRSILTQIGKSSLNPMIPEVMKLGKLYLVNPASTATCERTFSHLRRLKNYLRSTMSQSRLNHVLLLNVYKEHVDHINLEEIINVFENRTEMRRNAFL